MTFPVNSFFTTVRITLPDQNDEEDSVGTGFLLGIPLTDETGADRGIIALITNKHVFEDGHGRIILHFHKKHPDGDGPILGPGIRFEEDYTDHYVEHPNPKIDLAMVGIAGPRNYDNLFFTYEGPGNILDSNSPALYPGKDILFVGYPDGHFDQANNLPIMRSGRIATIPQIDFDGEPVFIIDAPVVEGSSGSAVYAQVTTNEGINYMLAGVVSRYFHKDRRVEFNDQLDMRYSQLIDLGVVIKTSAIYELINHLIETRLPECRLDGPEPNEAE